MLRQKVRLFKKFQMFLKELTLKILHNSWFYKTEFQDL